jgi:type IV secretory pathway TraG/TraD family ATPase VirD4
MSGTQAKRKGVKIQSGVYNTIFAAPTRSGKGVSSVIPVLLTYPESSKGESFEESDIRDANLIAGILTTPASKLKKG